MKITVTSYADSDEDCRRDTYVTVVNGKEYLLAPCALAGFDTYDEIEQRARNLFGENVEVVYSFK